MTTTAEALESWLHAETSADLTITAGAVVCDCGDELAALPELVLHVTGGMWNAAALMDRIATAIEEERRHHHTHDCPDIEADAA